MGSRKKSGDLVVGVLTDPLLYQSPAAEEIEGLEYDLALAFAENLGAKVRFVVAADMRELIDMISRGKVHYAAAVPSTIEEAGLRFTSPLRETRQVVVQHADRLLQDEPDDIAGREIEVLRGSAQAKALERLGLEPPPKVVE